MPPVASTSRAPVLVARHASTVASTPATKRLPFRGALTLSPETRRYPIQKAAKFKDYQDLFSSSQLLLFLRVDGLSVKEVNNLRADIKTMLQQQRAAQSPDDVPVDLTFTHVRANLVTPVLASLPHLPSGLISQHTKGPLAVVTSQHLHPPSLAQFLRIFQKHAKEFNKPLEDAAAAGKKGPGGKKAAPQPRDRLVLRSGIAEQRKELTAADIQQLSTLPDLKGVQSQIIGVVDATAAQLVRVLSQASGGEVAQTLEGFKVGLEESGQPKEASA